MKSRLRIAAYLSLVTIAAIACDQSACRTISMDLLDQFAASFGDVVTVPQADSTPPSVSLTISDRGSGKIVLTSASAPLRISLDRSDSFFVIAAAEDPEGVKEVGFVGGSRVQCTRDGVGYIQTATLIGPTDIDNAGAGGQALTRRWLPRFVDDSYLGCSSGWTFVSASLTLQAQGKNFSGGAAQSAPVTFTWSP